MKLLCQNFKYLPKNIEIFKFCIPYNDLDPINMKYLSEGLK